MVEFDLLDGKILKIDREDEKRNLIKLSKHLGYYHNSNYDKLYDDSILIFQFFEKRIEFIEVEDLGEDVMEFLNKHINSSYAQIHNEVCNLLDAIRDKSPLIRQWLFFDI